MAHVIFEDGDGFRCEPIGPTGLVLPRGKPRQDGSFVTPRHAVIADKDVPSGPFVVTCWEPLTWEPDTSQTALRAHAAAKRWALETGGITLENGAIIATDAISHAKIDAKVAAFERGVITGSVAFKAVNGSISLDRTAMTAVYAAVAVHVEACFAAERAVVHEIAAGTITTIAQIDNSPHWSAVAAQRSSTP